MYPQLTPNRASNCNYTFVDLFDQDFLTFKIDLTRESQVLQDDNSILSVWLIGRLCVKGKPSELRQCAWRCTLQLTCVTSSCCWGFQKLPMCSWNGDSSAVYLVFGSRVGWPHSGHITVLPLLLHMSVRLTKTSLD